MTTPGASPPPGGRPGTPAAEPKSTPPPEPKGPATPTPATTTDSAPSTNPSLSANQGGVRKTLNDAGNVSERQKLTESANRNLMTGSVTHGNTQVQGNYIGMQLVTRMTDAAVRPGELPRRFGEAVQLAYAGEEALLAAVKAHTDRRTLIFCAEPGHGKTAAAVRLLQHRQVSRIMLLRPDQDLEQFQELSDDTGYILCDPPSAAGISAHALNTISPLLEKHRSHIVVTISDTALLSEEDLLDMTVQLPAPPEHTVALAKHLEWLLPTQAATLQSDNRLTMLVTESLDTSAPLRQIGELAAIIAAVHRERAEVDFDEVRRLLDLRADQAFMIWFDRLDPENRMHAIALAVLNGLPSEFVMEGMRALRRKLDPVTSGLVAGGNSTLSLRQPTDPFKVSRRERFAALRATVSQETVRGEHGVTRSQAVRFLDKTYAERVIRRAWSEFSAQRVMLDWLGELVAHPAEAVRIQAATAVGILTTDSFEYVSRTVLDRWAIADSPRRRAAAAHALHVPMADPELRPVVQRMVRGWVEAPAFGEDGDFGDSDEPDPRAQATAAKAYGYSIGRNNPDGALKALHGLALADDIRVAVAIGESLAELVLHDPDRLTEPVLATVLQWLGEGETSVAEADREPTGHLAFLILATSLLTDSGTGPGDGGAAQWPTLLWLAHEQPALGFGLASLWHHLLMQGQYFPRAAEDVLYQWARYVEFDPDGCAALAEILRMACERDELRLLRNHVLVEVTEWTGADVPTPTHNAARAVREALNDQGAGL
jgi:hypothetical protein